MDITTNLISLVSTNRRAANIRRKGFSESLTLQRMSINRADKTWLGICSKRIRPGSIEVVTQDPFSAARRQYIRECFEKIPDVASQPGVHHNWRQLWKIS